VSDLTGTCVQEAPEGPEQCIPFMEGTSQEAPEGPEHCITVIEETSTPDAHASTDIVDSRVKPTKDVGFSHQVGGSRPLKAVNCVKGGVILQAVLKPAPPREVSMMNCAHACTCHHRAQESQLCKNSLGPADLEISQSQDIFCECDPVT